MQVARKEDKILSITLFIYRLLYGNDIGKKYWYLWKLNMTWKERDLSSTNIGIWKLLESKLVGSDQFICFVGNLGSQNV